MEQYIEVIFCLIVMTNGILYVKLMFHCYSELKNTTKYSTFKRNISINKFMNDLIHYIVPKYFLILKRKIPTIELSDEEDSLL